MDLYRLRDAPRPVKLATVLFLLVLGYSYLFAFLMVKTWSGLTPSQVAATYVPLPAMDMSAMLQGSAAIRSRKQEEAKRA